MDIYFSLPQDIEQQPSSVLSIGNFDGVHAGHKQILQQLNKVAKRHKAKSVVLTFLNHPSKILRPEQDIPLLCTLEHKILLLEKENVDSLFLLPFTLEFSEQSAVAFLKEIQRSINFTALVLGNDATIGKQRAGTQAVIQALAKEMNFEIDYLPDCQQEGVRISSSAIRQLIRSGNLEAAAKLLGRPYSIYGKVIEGLGRGSTIGYKTANIKVDNLCLPPFGVYAVEVNCQKKNFPAVANLGFAPTLRNDPEPTLEVHLFGQDLHLYGESIDVQLHHYIRKEMRFANIEQLKSQIAADIMTAKAILNKLFN